eukprot:m.55641 g.55641  ORF g.55641 m.55641 type:complete len:765 (+) comp11979_c1_seq1:1622-3916(+)
MDAQLMAIAGQAAAAMVDHCIAAGEPRFNTPEKLPRAQALLEPVLLRVAVLFLESMACNEPCAVTLRIGEDSEQTDAAATAGEATSNPGSAQGAEGNAPKKGWLKSISSKLSNININLKSPRGEDGVRKMKAREGSVYRYNPGSHMWVKSKLHLHEGEQGPVLDLFPVSKSSAMTSILCRSIDSVEPIETPCVYGQVFCVRYLACELMMASSSASDWIADLLDGIALARTMVLASTAPTFLDESSTDTVPTSVSVVGSGAGVGAGGGASLNASASSRASRVSTQPPKEKDRDNEYDVPVRIRNSVAPAPAPTPATAPVKGKGSEESSNYEEVDPELLAPSPDNRRTIFGAPGPAGSVPPSTRPAVTDSERASAAAVYALVNKSRNSGSLPSAGPLSLATPSSPTPGPASSTDTDALPTTATGGEGGGSEEADRAGEAGAVYARVVKPARRSDPGTDALRAPSIQLPAASLPTSHNPSHPPSHVPSRGASRPASPPTAAPVPAAATAAPGPALPARRTAPEIQSDRFYENSSSASTPQPSSTSAPATAAPASAIGPRMPTLQLGPGGSSGGSVTSASSGVGSAGASGNAPELPRRSGALLSPTTSATNTGSLSFPSSNPMSPSPSGPLSSTTTTATDEDPVESVLRGFPWYHGNISAADARDLVERGANGAYLIRRSDSQKGQYVLCLNWCGTGTLLRIQTNPDGKCMLCGLKFANIPALVSYFTYTPFPTNPDQRHQVVTLTEVMRARSAARDRDRDLDDDSNA